MRSDEREPTAGERLRDAFTPEARKERLLRAADRRSRRTSAIERAFGKQNSKKGANDDG